MSAAIASSPAETTAVGAGATPACARDLALRFFDFLNRGQPRAAWELMDPDAFVEIVPAGLKGVAAREGRRFLEALVAAFPDLLIQVRSIMATEDLAVVEIKLEGTQAADFLGILNQEKHVDMDQAWMLWAAREKIVGIRAYGCQNQLYRRLAVKRLDRISILG
jgi:predicted ester cyclase